MARNDHDVPICGPSNPYPQLATEATPATWLDRGDPVSISPDGQVSTSQATFKLESVC